MTTLYWTGSMLVLTALLSGCGAAATSPPVTVEAAPECDQAYRICNLIDFSTSTEHFDLFPPSLEEVKEVVEVLAQSGCEFEFAIGAIEARSKPLLRLRMDAIPAKFRRVPERPHFRTALEFDAFRGKYKAYHAQREQRVGEYLAEVDQFLAAGVTAQSTNLYDALYRAGRYLSEPDRSFSKPVTKIAAIQTDGIHNGPSSYRPLPSDVTYQAIVGNADLNLELKKLDPAPFQYEAARAAYRDIISMVEDE